MRMLMISLLILSIINGQAYGQKHEEILQQKRINPLPGESQKLFEGMVGSWDLTTKLWNSAKAQPMESKGLSKFKLILAGRYLQESVSTIGQPFQGIGHVGHDNIQKKYVSTWMDNWNTGIRIGEGYYNSARKELTDMGTYSSVTKGESIKYWSTLRIVNKDTMIHYYYIKDEQGKVYLETEKTYKRK